MAKKTAKKRGMKEDSKIWAFVAYLLSLIGFILIYVLKKDDDFAMYHAKQSLVLFIFSAFIGIIGTILPFIGWIVILTGNVLIIALWVQGIVLALTGQKKPLWLIGTYAEKMKF